jgi:hypothetical protein
MNIQFKRKVRKPSVSRSMRLPPEIDRALEQAARKKGWSKSFLIRDILFSWVTFHKAKAKIE